MHTHTETTVTPCQSHGCAETRDCRNKKEAEISQALIVNAVKRSLQGSPLPK